MRKCMIDCKFADPEPEFRVALARLDSCRMTVSSSTNSSVNR
jgi:hypothetical protein